MLMHELGLPLLVAARAMVAQLLRQTYAQAREAYGGGAPHATARGHASAQTDKLQLPRRALRCRHDRVRLHS